MAEINKVCTHSGAEINTNCCRITLMLLFNVKMIPPENRFTEEWQDVLTFIHSLDMNS